MTDLAGLIERLRKVSDRRSLTIGAIWTIAGEAADEITRLQAELAEARDQDRLIMVLAEVREASGVGHKPMLGEVPAAIRARFEGIEARATRAEAQRDAALVALRPFAEVAEHDVGEDEVDADRFRPMSPGRNKAPAIRVGHLRAARQALTSLSPAKDEDPTHD